MPSLLVFSLRWEVVVHYVDIGGIVDHNCLNFLFITQNILSFLDIVFEMLKINSTTLVTDHTNDCQAFLAVNIQ